MLAIRFDPHLAEKVDLAERHALHPKNVIGGRRVEIEVRQREGEQEVFGGERNGEVPEPEDNLTGDLDGRRVKRLLSIATGL